MEKKIDTTGTVLAFATYKPKEGKEQELMELVNKHVAALRALELVTERNNYVAQAADGTVIEVFEWTSTNAINAAHQHPAIANIWEKMSPIADFVPMNTLLEGQRPFAGFKILN